MSRSCLRILATCISPITFVTLLLPFRPSAAAPEFAATRVIVEFAPGVIDLPIHPDQHMIPLAEVPIRLEGLLEFVHQGDSVGRSCRKHRQPGRNRMLSGVVRQADAGGGDDGL